MTTAVDPQELDEVPPKTARALLVPAVWSVLFVAVGLAYLFGWGPLVLHHSQWSTGGDLWGIFRGAHYVGWGDLGGMYERSDGIVTLPGMPVLLTPVALLSSSLGLSESAPGFTLSHPTAALLLQPVELLLGCTVLFAVHSLAVATGIGRARRWWLIGVVSAVAWPVVAVWGHAEDLVAVTLAVCALRIVLGERDRMWGWLLGAGIVIQPLVGLLLPLFLGVAPAHRRLRALVQSVLPSIALLGVALAGNWSDTYRAVVKQPTPPSLNHATPWVSLAPRVIEPAAPHSQVIVHAVRSGAGTKMESTVVAFHTVAVVSGGPVRILGLLCAIGVGVYAWRKRPDMAGIVWLAGLALSVRCYFEPVMTPYYLAPPLLVALLAAASRRRWRFGVATALALADTVFGYYRFGPWVWWLPVVGMLTGVLACGFPGMRHVSTVGARPEHEPASPSVGGDDDGAEAVPAAPVEGSTPLVSTGGSTEP